MKFKHYQTKSTFLTDLGDNKIVSGDICFIKDAQQIYTHGTYYDCSSDSGSQSDWNQNDTTADDYIKNRTHYVENVSTSSVWNQTGCSVGSGTTSPGGYPTTFNITTGNKYNVTISQGSNSKTYEGLTAAYDSVFNGLALRKNWSDSMGMSDTSTDALLLVVQPSNVVLRSADIYGENCTVQVSEVTETIHKLDRKYLPALNEIDSISSSKSGKVTTVTITETNGDSESFNISDGVDGQDGIDGDDGKSAYQVAVDNGYSGTEAQWLASLKGADGVDLGQAAVVQVTGQSQTDLMSQKAVTDEVVYPDVTYANVLDLPDITNGRALYLSAPNWYYNTNSNYACSGIIDVRNYDLITYDKFSSNNANTVHIFDTNQNFIGGVKVPSVQSISRQDYPNMGFIIMTTMTGGYTNNWTVNLRLSNGHRVLNQLNLHAQDLNKYTVNSFSTSTRTTFYEGNRLTDKTIVIMANRNNGSPNLMGGTIAVSTNAQSQVVITGLSNFSHGGKQSISLILCFDAEGNLKAYLNGVLKGTAAYTNYADTGWKLYIREGAALYSHFSFINADLSEYVSIIENQGWENWMPANAWMEYGGNTYSGSTTKGGWLEGGFHNNEMVKATVTLVNDTSSSKHFAFSNVTSYPSGGIDVEANSSVTWTRLIDVRTQKALGQWASASTTNISSTWTATSVGFIWGLDARYCHNGGAYNLHRFEYGTYPITINTTEVVPRVLGSSGAGSAVGQIRADANGNLQMYNGTTWKQINNS